MRPNITAAIPAYNAAAYLSEAIESLLAQILPPGSSRFVRIHGPYISEQETARLCSFLRKQGKPVYDSTITAEDKPVEKTEFEKDDLYEEAARIVVSSGQPSISYLQRRLRIGFSRAARLIDMMEMDGVVSPPEVAVRSSGGLALGLKEAPRPRRSRPRRRHCFRPAPGRGQKRLRRPPARVVTCRCPWAHHPRALARRSVAHPSCTPRWT